MLVVTVNAAESFKKTGRIPQKAIGYATVATELKDSRISTTTGYGCVMPEHVFINFTPKDKDHAEWIVHRV